jgi:hypothetical protein
MSFFDDASLVMIPSGYKDQKVYSVKPLDGSGDLTFSRASSATRVASNGLIEKVRTNLILQSQNFDNASWVKTGAGGAPAPIVTANAGVAPDGTTTADRVYFDTTGGTASVLGQSIAGAIGYTFSIYLKSNTGTNQTIYLRSDSSPITGTTITATNTWQRFTFTAPTWSSTTRDIGLDLRSTLAATSDLLVWGAQWEASDIATDYIPTTTAAVSVGPVSGLPRLDYTNSSCPRLLLEPQRTNLALFSEQFDNAGWDKTGVTVTANNAVSPDGFTNADLLTADGANSIHDIFQLFAGGTANSVSIFVKKGTARYINVVTNYVSTGSDWVSVVFDLDTLTSNVDQSGGLTSISVKIEDYGNGYYRLVSNTNAATATTLYVFYGIVDAANPTRGSRGRVALTSSATIIAYGAQAEAGAYATSYIPTLAASVTRVADAASKTGISSLIGQTEGTIFVEGSIIGKESVKSSLFAALEKTSSGATMRMQYSAALNIIYADVYTGATFTAQLNGPAMAVNQTFKAALAYKENDFALAVNGVIVATDNSGVVPTTDDLKINTSIYGNLDAGVRESQLLLFKTRLTNAQLAELTA